MDKADGAFLTIGELAQELGVAQHILRYWETRFPQLRPLQRAGNRRYYRPHDVEVARRINRLLNVEGFTIKGAAKALNARATLPAVETQVAPAPPAQTPLPIPAPAVVEAISAPPLPPAVPVDLLVERLRLIRGALADALGGYESAASR